MSYDDVKNMEVNTEEGNGTLTGREYVDTRGSDCSSFVIFIVVGGVLLLFSVGLVTGIIWAKKRRYSMTRPQKGSNRRSGNVSADVETALRAPIGFNHGANGFDGDLGENIITAQSNSPNQRIHSSVPTDNGDAEIISDHETAVLVTLSAQSKGPNQRIDSKTPADNADVETIPEQKTHVSVKQSAHSKSTNERIRSKSTPHDADVETIPGQEKAASIYQSAHSKSLNQRIESKISTDNANGEPIPDQKTDVPANQSAHSSVPNQGIDSTPTDAETISDHKTAVSVNQSKIDACMDCSRETCSSESETTLTLGSGISAETVDGNMTMNLKNSSSAESVQNTFSTKKDEQTKTEIRPEVDDYTEKYIPKILPEVQPFEDCEMIYMPPPSPCKSEICADYINVPAETQSHSSPKNAIVKSSEYVNVTDDIKGSSKDSVLKTKAEKSMSYSDLSIKEEGNLYKTNSYVNIEDEIEKPPSYDELSVNKHQMKYHDDSNTDFQSRPDYVNIPKEIYKTKGITTSIIAKKICKSDTVDNDDSKFKESMYLSMDSPTEHENEYLPISNPTNLSLYEGSRTLNQFSKPLVTKPTKSLDTICLPDYVNIESRMFVPSRSSSCDNVYSYAEPDVFCDLYLGHRRLAQKLHNIKSKALNRSKTFSSEDSKANSYKTQVPGKRPKDNIGNLIQADHVPKNYARVTQRNNAKQILADEKHTLKTDRNGYVNAGRNMSKPAARIAKIPLSTKRRGSYSVLQETLTCRVYQNNCDETVEEGEHDYENAKLPKKCMKPPTVFPKPRGPSRIPRQVSKEYDNGKTCFDINTLEEVFTSSSPP